MIHNGFSIPTAKKSKARLDAERSHCFNIARTEAARPTRDAHNDIERKADGNARR